MFARFVREDSFLRHQNSSEIGGLFSQLVECGKAVNRLMGFPWWYTPACVELASAGTVVKLYFDGQNVGTKPNPNEYVPGVTYNVSIVAGVISDRPTTRTINNR